MDLSDDSSDVECKFQAAGPSSAHAALASTSHKTSTMERTQDICKYFKMGTCHYGTSCRNAHVQLADTSQIDIAAGPSTSSISSNFSIDPLKWINAPEFIPKSKQFGANAEQKVILPESDAVEPGSEDIGQDEEDQYEAAPGSDAGGIGSSLSYAEIVTLNNNHNGLGIIEEHVDVVLCPYYENSGVCLLDSCPYEHGEMCELCRKFCLNPLDKEQQRQHNAECIKQHELDMEHSFAIQRSKDKICGICLEVILEKPVREQRFGILPNCNHIFCLDCIRTWRKAKTFENKIKRGCPTCRISSDFVCPSIVWVEGRDDKDKLINDYKKACNTTHCKHFKQGSGKCPFGNKCFYKHALPSGQLVDVGGPSRQSESRIRISHLQDFFREVLHQRGRLIDDFVSSFFSDSEESEVSELYDYYDI